MQRDVLVKGRSLGASSDLTLLAPIRPGFVPALDSVTYKTRVKRVLEALHTARGSSHEFNSARLLSDSIERVGAILSVRVAVLEPEDKVLLAVSFDGSWQAYIRVLWDKVGSLLDLIFCGTVDYVTASDHSYEEWSVWARRVQVETGFYYGPNEGSARDLMFHRRVERMSVSAGAVETHQLGAVLPSAEASAAALVVPPTAQQPDDPPVKQPPVPMRAVTELFTTGLQGLAGLYRLADLHRPGSADGEVLRRAALDLLREFVLLCADGAVDELLDQAGRDGARFQRALAWLRNGDDRITLPRRDLPAAPAPSDNPLTPELLQRLQGGIVRGYKDVTHGALLLLAFDDAAAAADFMSWLLAHVSRGSDRVAHEGGPPLVNIGFTPAGLRALGLDEDTLALFPEEFRQGMAARAGLLGDVRNNHPRRWRLPRHAVWPQATASGPEPAAPTAALPQGAPEVETDTVHAVLQLRARAPDQRQGLPLESTSHPLHAFIGKLVQDHAGTRLLAWQEMSRSPDPDRPGAPKGHFGYNDGMGQPDLEPPAVPDAANRVHLGEVLLGYDNASDTAPDISDPALPPDLRKGLTWLQDGSFLALRKYRQFVDRFETAVQAAAQAMQHTWPGSNAEENAKIIYAKLMGRGRDGTPLVPHVPSSGPGSLDSNTFSYANDPAGQACPLHAHVRLAHPRAERMGAARPPRIVRRGMSYGPARGTGATADAEERGVVFIAYNASLGEQFEVVQHWLAGGNSTGSSTGQSCPVVGVPENGQPRHFRFEHSQDGKTAMVRVQLEAATPLFDEPAVSTRLEWGLYLFAPSIAVLQRLQQQATTAAGQRPVPWQPRRGREMLALLRRIETEQGPGAAALAWKRAIEDPDSIDRLDAAALWAAIRQDHGGVLDTPYGVLVAGRELIAQVLQDPQGRYSIRGQRERMKQCFGDIYLGMDEGPDYREEADHVNAAIRDRIALSGEHSACHIAQQRARSRLDEIFKAARQLAYTTGARRWEVAFDAREVVDDVLAALCEQWFGLQKSPFFKPGSTDHLWRDHEPPLYPGHFTALSRYMFQPNPGDVPEKLSVRYGQALLRAMRDFVADHSTKGTIPTTDTGRPAPIAKAIFEHPSRGQDKDWVARTMVGVMMGFIAPIIGATLNVLREWQRSGQFAALRTALNGAANCEEGMGLLERSMRAAASMRPMPQIIWRTAIAAHRLGGVDVAADRKVVMALASGTQETLQEGGEDDTLMFGGDRNAAHPPTHACPGRDHGRMALLGILKTLLTAQTGDEEKLRCAPVTWGFLAEGPVNPSPGLKHLRSSSLEAAPPKARARQAPARPLPPLPVPPRQGLVLAVGDSWLRSPYADGNDLRQQLERQGWTVPADLCNFLTWGKIATLARADKLATMRSTFMQQRARHAALPLQAVLVSAGGNDSTGTAFATLLKPDDNNVMSAALDPEKLAEHMARLMGHYRTVLNQLRRVLADDLRANVPVLLHGYDHSRLPIDAVTLSHWFRTPFEIKGYDPVKDRSEELDCMKELISTFNAALQSLCSETAYAGWVRWVDLQGRIAHHWNPADEGWRDDLHPHADAFVALADRIDEVLMQPRN